MSNCLFCKIIRKEIPAKVLYEDDLTLAFEDISPKAPTHVLVIPKKHLASLEDAAREDRECLGHLVMVARDLARRRSGDFVRTATEKLLMYALGRPLTYADMPTVRAIVRNAEAAGYRWSALILEVARSVPFRMRRAPA